MSILDDLIVDRVIGATYDWRDMNRVGAAMQHVAARLQACGWNGTVTPRTDFGRTNFPSLAVFDHYIQQLRRLREALSLPITTPLIPEVGSTKDYMTYAEANDIEQILQDVDAALNRMAAAWYYSGTIYSGGEELN